MTNPAPPKGNRLEPIYIGLDREARHATNMRSPLAPEERGPGGGEGSYRPGTHKFTDEDLGIDPKDAMIHRSGWDEDTMRRTGVRLSVYEGRWRY